MTPRRFLSGEPLGAAHLRFFRRSTAQSLWAVEQRLATAEWELRIQFTRTAQLQAELDLLLTTLRRETEAHAMSLRVECLRVNSDRGLSSGA